MKTNLNRTQITELLQTLEEYEGEPYVLLGNGPIYWRSSIDDYGLVGFCVDQTDEYPMKLHPGKYEMNSPQLEYFVSLKTFKTFQPPLECIRLPDISKVKTKRITL